MVKSRKKISGITLKYYFIICIYTIIDFLFGPAYTTYMQDQGLSIEKIGLILAAWSICSFLFEIPSGGFADKYGRRRAMIYGFAIWGMGLILYGFSESMFSFLLSFLLIAFGMAFISGTPDAWYVSNSLAEGSYSPNALSVSQAISLFLSTATGVLFTFLTANGRENAPYLLSGGIALFFCLILRFGYSENYVQTIKKNRKLSYYITTSWKQLWKNPILKMYLLKIFLISLASQLFILGWQLYVMDRFVIRKNMLGLLLSFLTVMLAVGFSTAAILCKKINGIQVSVIGNCILAVGALVICMADHLQYFLIGAALLEIGLGMEKGAGSMWIQVEIEEEVRSTSFSFFEVFRVIAAFTASLCLSFLVPFISFQRMWYISLAAGISSCLVLKKIYCMKHVKV